MKKELERLYTSKDPEDILKFYESIGSLDELIGWMKNRPSEKMILYQQAGDKSIVVVIPTADFNGKFATYCKNYYNGFQIIFVESKGPFFNFARSCNLGVEKALDYNPDWIIISNDDIYSMDELSKLRSLLANIRKGVKSVYIICGGKEPMNCTLIKSKSKFYDFYSAFKGGINKRVVNIEKKFDTDYSAYVTNPFVDENLWQTSRKKVATTLFHPIASFTLEGAFWILSGEFAKSVNGKIFDEAYINSFEDVDLSYNIFKNKNNYEFIKFKIGMYESGTLGVNAVRWLRSLTNKIYFNYKYRKELEGK